MSASQAATRCRWTGSLSRTTSFSTPCCTVSPARSRGDRPQPLDGSAVTQVDIGEYWREEARWHLVDTRQSQTQLTVTHCEAVSGDGGRHYPRIHWPEDVATQRRAGDCGGVRGRRVVVRLQPTCSHHGLAGNRASRLGHDYARTVQRSVPERVYEHRAGWWWSPISCGGHGTSRQDPRRPDSRHGH